MVCRRDRMRLTYRRPGPLHGRRSRETRFVVVEQLAPTLTCPFFAVPMSRPWVRDLSKDSNILRRTRPHEDASRLASLFRPRIDDGNR